jgi:hypothetical protein
MSFSLILIGISLALFGYWFRYSCLLILRTRTAEDFAGEICRENGLSFVQLKSAMDAEGAFDLDAAYSALQHDFGVVTQLLEQQAAANEGNCLEHRLVHVNFHFTQAWYRLSRSLGLASARASLEEMADTVAYFANSFGELNAASRA